MVSTGFGDHRRELSVLQDPPVVLRQTPPSASPSPISGIAAAGSTPSFLNSIFDHQDPFQLSPQAPNRPGTAPTAGASHDSYFPDEPRRPSVASVVTNASSTGSKSSMGRTLRKKFFGDGESPSAGSGSAPGSGSAAPSVGSPGSSESSLPANTNNNANATTNSNSNHIHNVTPRSQFGGLVNPVTPAISRPRTPVPSSEVVPFLYQDPAVRLLSLSPARSLA